MKLLSILGKQKIKGKCSQKKFGKILPQVTNLTTMMERTWKERNPQSLSMQVQMNVPIIELSSEIFQNN